MTSLNRALRPFVDIELRHAAVAERSGDMASAFGHLERAHVVGQASTVQHVRVHGLMFAWAVRHRQARECAGQLLRIVGAATKTASGWVPSGNTGGSNVSPFKSLPIPPDLEVVIDRALQGNPPEADKP